VKRLGDWPRPLLAADYERACEQVVARLAGIPGLIAVYRLGSWGVPGISDLDLAAVFEDGVVCRQNPLRGLRGREAYIVTHGLLGCSRSHFAAAAKHSGLWGFEHLRGERLPFPRSFDEGRWEAELKEQLALEFLLRLYVNQLLERAYGAHRVRGFLLQARGARCDLRLLEVREGALHSAVEEVEDARARWFRERPSEGEVLGMIDGFFGALEDFLARRLKQTPLAVAAKRSFAPAANILLCPGKRLQTVHRGRTLPSFLTARSKKLFNLQHRWNRFVVDLPMREATSNALLAKVRSDAAALAYNARHLPCFAPLKSPLHLRAPGGGDGS